MILRSAGVLGLLALGGAVTAAAQATGTPTFNAPYRAFSRSEFGVMLSFPQGGGTAVEGMYRVARSKFDLGFKVGFADPDGSQNAFLLAGAEARQRVITHNADFPLDGAVVVGVGAQLSSNASVFLIPVGLSLGRRVNVEGSAISIVPYLQPTLTLATGDGGSDVLFTLGIGADFRFTPRFDGRLSAGLGDLEGVSLGFVWVH